MGGCHYARLLTSKRRLFSICDKPFLAICISFDKHTSELLGHIACQRVQNLTIIMREHDARLSSVESSLHVTQT